MFYSRLATKSFPLGFTCLQFFYFLASENTDVRSSIEVRGAYDIRNANAAGDMSKWNEFLGTVISSVYNDGRLQHGWKKASVDFYNRAHGAVSTIKVLFLTVTDRAICSSVACIAIVTIRLDNVYLSPKHKLNKI